ncbi:MAG: hypothetical protein GVY17_05950 [Cyanobacteria bacterium]|nr:hypothetical protein [Cyanobacteria bacterium GSL.Bin21]
MLAQKPRPWQYFKNFIRQQVKSPAYRIILKIANYNRGLLLVAFNGNLLAAVFEGSTFGVVYVALRVLQEGSLAEMEQLSWLAPYVAEWSQGQLFISLIVLAIVMQFLRSGLSYVGLVSAGYLRARVRAQMIDQVFRQIMSLSFPCASSYKVGDLSQYIQDSQEAVNIELNLWNQLFVKFFIIISYVAVLIAISPVLSIVAIMLAGGLLAVQRYIIPRIRQSSREVTQAIVSVVKQIVESIQGLRLVHSFGRQRQTMAQTHHLTGNLVPLLQKQERFLQISQPLNQALTISTVGLLLILGFLILSNEQALVIPALFTFIAALNRLSSQLGSLAQMLNRLAENSG